MKKFRANLLDEFGCIRTGYEDYLEAETREEAIADYLYHIRENCGMDEITVDQVEIDLVDWE